MAPRPTPIGLSVVCLGLAGYQSPTFHSSIAAVYLSVFRLFYPVHPVHPVDYFLFIPPASAATIIITRAFISHITRSVLDHLPNLGTGTFRSPSY